MRLPHHQVQIVITLPPHLLAFLVVIQNPSGLLVVHPARRSTGGMLRGAQQRGMGRRMRP
jgi:hypothetical protein